MSWSQVGQLMMNCFAIRNGHVINTFVSVSMAQAPSPCGRARNLRISDLGVGEIAAGFICIVLHVSFAYAPGSS
jgi:hypothetical protein